MSTIAILRPQVVARRVQSVLVVVLDDRGDSPSGFGQAGRFVLLDLLAQRAVEAFNYAALVG
jgi:hypothetical protein